MGTMKTGGVSVRPRRRDGDTGLHRSRRATPPWRTAPMAEYHMARIQGLPHRNLEARAAADARLHAIGAGMTAAAERGGT